MTIRAMNCSWTEAWNEKEFRKYIHPDAVAIVCRPLPGGLKDGMPYVAGWKSIIETTKVHEWEETDHHMQIYASGRCAGSRVFSATSSRKAGTCTNGIDMFFLVRKQRKWLVVADKFSPDSVHNTP